MEVHCGVKIENVWRMHTPTNYRNCCRCALAKVNVYILYNRHAIVRMCAISKSKEDLHVPFAVGLTCTEQFCSHVMTANK